MEKSNVFYVYVMFRPWNGIPCYVGKGSGRRAHIPSRRLNPHLESIIKKAGGPLPTVIIRCGMTEDQAFATEIALIKAIGRGSNGPLANLTDGGEGTSGWVAPAEWRANLSKRATGSHYNKGRKQSEEEIEKRRRANTGKKRSADVCERFRGKNNPMYGRPSPNPKGGKRDPSIGAKISAVKKGVSLTIDHRQKLSVAAKGNQKRLGKYHSEETKRKISETKKRSRGSNLQYSLFD